MVSADKSSDKPIERINPNAAGIDIGSRRHYVCVGEKQRVRSFGPYTPDLEEMAGWLRECGVTTVAMESAGVYWVAVHQVLEQQGLDVRCKACEKCAGPEDGCCGLPVDSTATQFWSFEVVLSAGRRYRGFTSVLVSESFSCRVGLPRDSAHAKVALSR